LNEAEPIYREALEVSRRTLGDTHPSTLTSINNHATLLQDQGKLNEAEPLLKEALEVSRRILGSTHPSTLTSVNNLGLLFKAQGKLSEAESTGKPWKGAVAPLVTLILTPSPASITSVGYFTLKEIG